MYLERWLHAVMRAASSRDSDLRRYLPSVGSGPINRSGVEGYQEYLLHRALEYAYERSDYYRDVFDRHGVRPQDVQSRQDLKRLPFTEPEDLAAAPFRFLCLSRAQIARIHTFVTSGTTGPQKRVFWTQGDLDRIVRFMAAGIGTVADGTDVVHICLPGSTPYGQADLLARGTAAIGAEAVHAGMELTARQQLDLITRRGGTVLFGYADYIHRLTRELQSFTDLGQTGVRVLFLAAEYVPEARRRALEKAWNCRVHTHYGLTEMGVGVAVECCACDGYHYNEADLLLEIIDPETLEPTAPGSEGELVFTTLTREAMPLIRYRTRDISHWIPEFCGCGASSLDRFAAVKKRLGAAIRVGGGDEVHRFLFDDVLSAIPDLLDYRVDVVCAGGLDRFDFHIETMADPETVQREIGHILLSLPLIEQNLRAGTMAPPSVEITACGALKNTGRAKKTIIDRRPSGPTSGDHNGRNGDL